MTYPALILDQLVLAETLALIRAYDPELVEAFEEHPEVFTARGRLKLHTLARVLGTNTRVARARLDSLRDRIDPPSNQIKESG